MNLSFASLTAQRKSHLCDMRTLLPEEMHRWGCPRIPLTAPVARGQKPPVGPASSDDGCTVNVRENTVCRRHVIKRRDDGAVGHGDDHRRTVLHVD